MKQHVSISIKMNEIEISHCLNIHGTFTKTELLADSFVCLLSAIQNVKCKLRTNVC